MDNYKCVGLEVRVKFGVPETTRFTYVEYWLKFLFWVGYLFEYSWCKSMSNPCQRSKLGFHIHPIIRAKAVYLDSTIKYLVTLAQKVLSLGRGEDSRFLEEHKWVSLNSSLVVILDWKIPVCGDW